MKVHQQHRKYEEFSVEATALDILYAGSWVDEPPF